MIDAGVIFEDVIAHLLVRRKSLHYSHRYIYILYTYIIGDQPIFKVIPDCYHIELDQVSFVIILQVQHWDLVLYYIESGNKLVFRPMH
jgi:hypothetical protein